MRRRDLPVLIVGMILGAPVVAEAQEHVPVVGILAVASPENAGAQRNLVALRAALAEAGFVEGRTVTFEYRWANTDYRRLPELAADLVSRKVDVIVVEDVNGQPIFVLEKFRQRLLKLSGSGGLA